MERRIIACCLLALSFVYAQVCDEDGLCEWPETCDGCSDCRKGCLLLFDDFEYPVDRNRAGDAELFTTVGPWDGVKAINSNAARGGGWLYTTASIPGYSGTMPGVDSNRVLKIEALNIEGGTDFYLQYGGSVADTVPADVWFQFWIYINRHAESGELSAVENRHKFIYPATDTWPGWPRWLISFSSSSYVPWSYSPFGNPSTGGGFIVNRDMDSEGAPVYSPEYPDNHWKLGPNHGGREESYIPFNEWYLVKIHMDTSNASSGKMEIWLKPHSSQWRKTTEWIGGVTQDFTWSGFDAGGHVGFRMPTTIGWTNRADGAFYYLDDFAMSSSEDALPVYSEEAYCGDALCSNGETCSSCMTDCPIPEGSVCCLGMNHVGNCCSEEDCPSGRACIDYSCTQCIHTADKSPCDGVLSLSELRAVIASWRTGSVGIRDLMEAIRIWKG
jgi:hypothetical protein